MSGASDVVISIAAARTDGWDRKDLKRVDGRYRCLVRIRGYLITVVLCANKLSPSREYIYLGDDYSDQCRGWFQVTEIELVEVLAKVEPSKPAPQRPWWKRLLWIQ